MNNNDFVIIAPLYNFTCDSTINLSSNVIIKKTSVKDEEIINKFLSINSVDHISRSQYSLYIYNQKIKADDLSRAKHLIEKYILLLRIFRKGNIYFNFLIIDKNSNIITMGDIFHTQLIHYYIGWYYKGLTNSYELSTKDEEALQIFIKLYESKDLMNQRAFRSFFRGFHEPLSDDRFLDNVISLENVLCNDSGENSNIRYKFIDRGLFLLCQIIKDCNLDVYTLKLKNIYSMRCKLVHTSKKIQNWIGEDYNKLLYDSDDFARKLLRYKLENQNFKESTHIDDLKRSLY